MEEKIARCFAILELEQTATLEEVRDAYRILSQVWHPDKHTPGTKVHTRSLEKQKQINEAYEQLVNYYKSNKTSKKEGSKQRSSPPPPPPPPPPNDEPSREAREENEFSVLLALANSGDRQAQFLVAECYYNGKGVKRNSDLGNIWCEKAAKQGFAPAQLLLIEPFLVSRDETKRKQAMRWLRISAENGSHKSMHRLAELLSFTDMNEAVRWWNIAAKTGYAPSQFALGRYFLPHEEIYTDSILHHEESTIKSAMRYYRMAADQDYPPALRSLAHMYRCGIGTHINLGGAIGLLTRAAECGDVESQIELGNWYATLSKFKNSDKAVYWCQRAAEGGSSEAQFQLGKLFELGEVVPRDLSTARKWYQMAAESGHVGAKRSLQRIQKQI